MAISKPYLYVGFIFTALLLNSMFQNCSGPQAEFSLTEEKLLNSNPFEYNYGDTNSSINDIYSDYDAIPLNPYIDGPQWLDSTVTDCSAPGRYEKEKAEVLEEAKADVSGRTVPVQFSYSFGDKHDVIAEYANTRAVLSKANPGVSYIPVGGKKSSSHNGKHFYYKANHDKAKKTILRGQKMFL
jgi:hypothetical protein